MLNNIEIWVKGHSRSFEIAPFGRSHMRSYLEFHGIYGIILYHFQDKARHWSKITIFHTLAFSAPVKRSPSKYCHVWCEKIRTVWLLLLWKPRQF